MRRLLKNILLTSLFICLLFSMACSNNGANETPNLNIKEESVQIYIDQSIKLNIEKTGLKDDIIFSVDQPSVASINADGTVIGLSEGTTIITASVGELKDTCRVIVLKRGASSAEFPFITVANDKVSVNMGGVYLVYPKLFIGSQQIENVNFSVSVEKQAIISATCESGIVEIEPIAVGTSKLIISTTQEDKIIEKEIIVTVLADVGSETVTGFITQNGVSQINLNGISGKTADVYIDNLVITSTVYPDSISFALTESQMSILDGKSIGDEISVTILGDNGKVYSTKIAVFESVNYDKPVYIQANGEIKGLDGFDSINFAGVNFEIYNVEGITYVSGDEWTAIKNSLTFGDVINGSVLQDNKVIEIEIKYVTIAISNYDELESIENGAANYYVLTNDIDCSGEKWVTANNTPFVSVFDGNGYAIRNLTLSNLDTTQYNGYSDNTFIGIHGWQCKFITLLGESAVIKNVVFDGIKSYGDITKTALFGRNNGLIENVVISVAAPTIDGFAGLVGENNGTIKNCVLDYTVQDKWLMGYISTINNGTIQDVIVNCPTAFEIEQSNTFALILYDNASSENCIKVKKNKADMISYITKPNLKEMYKKISINALSKGEKSVFDFNGQNVNGYTVNMDYATTFQFTQDYINDLKMRDIVGVKVWAKCSGYLYMPPKTEGALGGSDRTDWQDYSTWKAINIGRNFSQENNDNMPAAYYNRVFSDTVITPEQLALFDVGCAVNPSDTVYIYIEEFTADTVPVVSGKEYTTRTETIGEQEVTVYRVEFNSNNTLPDQNNAISGFMISEGYLDKLAEEGYTSISLMVKTDGLLNTSIGYRIGDANWQADWRNSSVLSDWTVINHTITNAPYTIAQAKDLHINGLEGNGLPYPTYVEFYIVANK